LKLVLNALMNTEIANVAARLILSDGVSYASAKLKALKELGLPERTPVPSNDALDEAIRDYIAIFCPDQPQELLALRRHALDWMERLEALSAHLRPHLTGAVWNGTATKQSDIWIQLFCDDSKAAELALIDKDQAYEVGSTRGFKGKMVDVLSMHSVCAGLGLKGNAEDVGVHLVVYDYDDLRGALITGQRGDAKALRKLIGL
jgi:hypothetical protein